MYMHIYTIMVYTTAAGPPIYGCVHVPCLISSLHGIHSLAYPTREYTTDTQRRASLNTLEKDLHCDFNCRDSQCITNIAI